MQGMGDLDPARPLCVYYLLHILFPLATPRVTLGPSVAPPVLNPPRRRVRDGTIPLWWGSPHCGTRG